ncbi:pyrroline-5-carboxylate reductase [Novimethylophilus kurashikiensis]|uniref:Pyrroline-5-carboxylate reductase n=1 Tax=Novimethylophilus kurashikiensis TaxID=1825523 RepID=A0A2R5FBP4_9PROT|nr:pyrroline-5-carboxylate reductase [Novimethylophilus kurashikiensis]
MAFVGGGNMARAIIIGLLAKGCPPADITVVEMDRDRRYALNQDFGINVAAELPAASLSDVIVLAVKPQQLRDVAIFLGSLLSNQLVISIAAGVRCSDLARWLGNYGAVVRVMPNTPAQVQAGVSALYAAPATTPEQRHLAGQLMSAVGGVVWLEDEVQMDAVTAVSGSGPAYVFYFLEAMQQAGVELGLSAEQVRVLAMQTFLGAAQLALGSEHDFATLRQQVTSKGGTTEQALLSMETNHVKDSIVQALHAAANRSRELGDILGNQ